jgi:hypothetical protein
MSGHTHRKKDGHRTEHQTTRRNRESAQPVMQSVTPARGNDVSNFTDGEVAGPDHMHEATGQLKYKSPVSEPKRRRTKER